MATNICRTPSNVCIEGIEDPPITSSAGSIPSTELIVREDLSSPFSFRPFAHALYEHTDSFGRSVRIFAVNSGASLAQQLPRTSFAYRLEPIEFESRHDFQVQEASIGGAWLVFLAVAVLFGKRVPSGARSAEILPAALREARNSFEVLASRRGEIAQAMELSRARVRPGVPQEMARNLLHLEVLETFQEVLETPEASSARLRALVERLNRASHSSMHANVLAEEIAHLAEMRIQQRHVIDELEAGERELSRSLHWEEGQARACRTHITHGDNASRLPTLEAEVESTRSIRTSTRGEIARARAELVRLDLLHSALSFVRNMEALQENAFVAAFGE